jgi:hypothetical protein
MQSSKHTFVFVTDRVPTVCVLSHSLHDIPICDLVHRCSIRGLEQQRDNASRQEIDSVGKMALLAHNLAGDAHRRHELVKHKQYRLLVFRLVNKNEVRVIAANTKFGLGYRVSRTF